MRRADKPYHIHMPIVLKCGSLSLLEPSGPVQACNGPALPFYLVNPITRQLHLLKHSDNYTQTCVSNHKLCIFPAECTNVFRVFFSEYTAFSDIRVADTMCFCDIILINFVYYAVSACKYVNITLCCTYKF